MLPLRPRGWRLARDGGGGEVTLGIGVANGVRAVVLDEQATAAKLLLDAPHGALQDLAHLAGLQVRGRVPDELGALLVIGAIQSDEVEVWIEPEIGRSSLHHGDGAGLRAADAVLGRALGIERLHRFFEDAREPAEESSVLREAAPPRERERQDPLAKGRLGQHALHEVGGRGAHPPSHTGRTKPSSLATERHQHAFAALTASQPREAAAEEPTVEVGLQLLPGMLGDPHRQRPVRDRAVQRLDVIAHDFIERGRLGATALVDGR